MKGKAMTLTAALIVLAGFGTSAAASCESDCFQAYSNCMADPNDGIPAPACEVLYRQCMIPCEHLRSTDETASANARRNPLNRCAAQSRQPLPLPEAKS